MVASRIAHYEILEKLGEGGMGAVYKARDTHLDRFVAIKVIRASGAADSDRYRRFVQEAKAASALSHPAIVTVHDIDEREGIPYIVMEYVAGKSLDALIPPKGMRINEALHVGAQIAGALAAAHEAGIVHRDLKPGNVMVSEKHQVKLVDFGLAKLTDSEPAKDNETVTTPLTAENTILGTAHYMSPEQAQGLPVDARSDIFSFGAVLYEMVAGRRAFQGNSTPATLGAVINNEPDPLPSDTPRDLGKIITRCLRKEPARRFQHMDDVKVALEELKEDSDSGKLAGVVDATPRWRARQRRWLPAVVVAAVILVAVPTWYYSRQPSPSPAAMKAVPLTTYPGREAQATFSPDGNQIAFAWNGPAEDNWDIYVRLVAEEGARRLTSDAARDIDPTWSPDGNHIAFLRVFPDRSDVITIPSIGGAERKIGEVHGPASAIYRTLAWLRTGRGLIVVHRPAPDEPYALFWLPPTGAEKVRITSPPAGWWGDRDPAVSPDGHTLVFDRATSDNLSEIYRTPISGDPAPRGEEQRVTRLNRYSITPAWIGNGPQIVFASASEGYWTPLWKLDLSKPDKPQRLPFVAEGSWQPAISAARNRLVYTQSQYDHNVWTADLVEGGRKAANPRALVASTRSDRDGAFSPDGKKIAFESTRSGTSEVWTCDRDGTNALKLTALGATRCSTPVWSPDGRSIAFTADVEGNQDIFVVGSQGAGARRITDDLAPDIEPEWSLDGRWVYFRSSRGGDWKAWRVALAGGPPEQADRPHGRASPDGGLVYFKKDSRLWKAETRGGPATQVFDSPVDGAFAPAANGVYFIGRQQPAAPLSINYYEFSTGKTRVLIQSQKLTAARLDLSPDQRSILYNQQDRNLWDLMIVENFR